MPWLTVTADYQTVEAVVFDWLVRETGDLPRAARLARGGIVEQTLDLNPGLALKQAANGDTLPIGTMFAVPDLPVVDAVSTVKLWGDD